LAVNHALAALDDLAICHGELIRGEDLLTLMGVGLPPPDVSQGPGGPPPAGRRQSRQRAQSQDAGPSRR
jgi:hypothetical protein